MSRLELIMMRHAKSDWGEVSLADHDRTLNNRGRRDAPRIGRWILEQDLVPDLVLCSTAVRAQQTIEAVAGEWPVEVPIHDSRTLYHAAPETIIKVVASDAMEAERVMVVGHNPGMEMLAGHFSGACGHFPTAAILALAFEIPEWSKLRLSSQAITLAATRPKAID
ncbi:phosphohistidine phosphatase [Rosistilla oblonga]|uniref:SixA phosphatase family protein n=1 Tax=Rosistilla oblonga TaxID=2527990 RepID=UPI001188EA75|nr:histidine phosphatase family protein [Rosistilla oblonga]QDV12500.1 phosphohistidine phosphatase [Rosistilla oblonga]